MHVSVFAISKNFQKSGIRNLPCNATTMCTTYDFVIRYGVYNSYGNVLL